MLRVTWGVAAVEPPARGEVAVWLTEPSEAHARAVEPWLAPEEEARRQRFQHHGARAQFLTGRWLLRSVVAALDGVTPAAVALRESERGALALRASPNAWYLNLSHTDGLVALAVARAPVGVDVEDTARGGRTVELADRFFAPAEAAALRALPVAAQRARFFDLWTLKEAYIKACGLGLAIPLASFAFALDGAELCFSVAYGVDGAPAEDAPRWRFARMDATPRHRLAVALRVPDEWARGHGDALPRAAG